MTSALQILCMLLFALTKLTMSMRSWATKVIATWTLFETVHWFREPFSLKFLNRDQDIFYFPRFEDSAIRWLFWCIESWNGFARVSTKQNRKLFGTTVNLEFIFLTFEPVADMLFLRTMFRDSSEARNSAYSVLQRKQLTRNLWPQRKPPHAC